MPRRKKHTLPLQIAPIPDGGYHCFLPITIHGRELHALVDTGASRSVFDLNVFKELAGEDGIELNEVMATGLGSSEIENYITVIDRMQIGEIVVEDLMAGLLDLSVVNVSYEQLGMPRVDGVIGMDLLMELQAIMDLKRHTIVLYG